MSPTKTERKTMKPRKKVVTACSTIALKNELEATGLSHYRKNAIELELAYREGNTPASNLSVVNYVDEGDLGSLTNPFANEIY